MARTASGSPTSPAGAGAEPGDEKEQRQPWTLPIIMPHTLFRNAWDTVMFTVIVYNTIMTPIRIAMLGPEDTAPVVEYLDYIFDVVFIVDTLMGFWKAYVDEDTKDIITDQRAISNNYLHSYTFYLNIFASLPGPAERFARAEYLGPWLSKNSKVCFLPRMVRLVHVVPTLTELKAFLEEHEILEINKSIFRMVLIMLLTVLANSVFGCFYFLLSCPNAELERDKSPEGEWASTCFCLREADDGTCMYPGNSWTQNDWLLKTHSPDKEFVRSVYFMIQTLFTIGYGDAVIPVSPKEMALGAVLMLLGTFLYALIIANMTSVLANVDVLRVRFRQEFDKLNEFMENRDIPDGLRQRIKTFYDYTYMKQSGMLEEKIMAEMPPKLREDIAQVNVKLISAIPFFDATLLSLDFIQVAARELRPRVYTPETTIVYQHEKQREMFIIRNGSAEVYTQQNDHPLSTLQPGDYFGDYQLLFGTVHPVAVKSSMQFVETLVLTFDSFQRTLKTAKDKNGKPLAVAKDHPALVKTEGIYKTTLNTYSKRNTLMSKATNKMKAMMMEIDTDELMGRWAIDPESTFHQYWYPTTILLMLYLLVMVPVRIMLQVGLIDETKGDPTPVTGDTYFDKSLYADYVVDVFFIVDMVLRAFFFAYAEIESGRDILVTDRRAIFKRYISSYRFRVELVASLPLDLCGFGTGWWAMWRLPHMLRVFLLKTYISDYSMYLEDVLAIVLSSGALSVIKMILTTVMLFLWTSVMWSIIHFNGHYFWRSLYWTVTTYTTVGYGDISPKTISETTFAFIFGVLGATFCAAIIANITSFVHSIDISEDNLAHRKTCMMQFMSERQVSIELQQRVSSYFQYIDEEKFGVDEMKMLHMYLPDHLRNDVILWMTHKLVLSCKIFRGCESSFLRAVMLKMNQQYYIKTEVILTEGKPAEGMYFMANGTVTLSIKGEAVSQVSNGASFAEDALLAVVAKNRFTASCSTYCEVWHLTRNTFQELTNEFPSVQDQLGIMKKRSARYNPSANRRTMNMGDEKLEEEDAGDKLTTYLHPDSKWMKIWPFVMLFFLVYNIIVIPFRIAFRDGAGVGSEVVVDYLGDICLLVDLIIHMRFLAFYQNDVLVLSRKEILQHAINNEHFWFNLIASLPIDPVCLVMEESHLFGRLQLLFLFRLNKLFRMTDMAGSITTCERVLAKLGVHLHKNGMRMFKLVMVMIVASHFFGCAFYMIASLQHKNAIDEAKKMDRCPKFLNWADNFNSEGFNDNGTPLSCPADFEETRFSDFTDELMSVRQVSRYIQALYWAIATLTTVGYGDISASDAVIEVNFSTIVLICGTLIYTMVIANLEDIVAQLDVTVTMFKQKVDRVKHYCLKLNLPEALRTSVFDYYDKLWAQQRGVQGTALLAFLPSNLRSDMVNELIVHDLKKLSFVKGCSEAVVNEIAGAMNLDLYMPDDFLFHKGELAITVFFIFSGTVRLMDEDTKQVFTTQSNAFLGEGEFFSRTLHPCSVQCSEHSQVFLLEFAMFWKIIEHHNLARKYRDFTKENEADIQKVSSKALIEKVKRNLKSNKMTKMLSHVAVKKKTGLVINPDTLFRYMWDIVSLLFAVYFAVSLPLVLGFSMNPGWKVQWVIVAADSCAIAFFWVDIYMHLMHFAAKQQGVLIVKPTEFRQLYMRSSLLSDIVSTLPVSIVANVIGVNPEAYPYLRFFYFVRVAKMGRYFTGFMSYLEDYLGIRVSTAGMMRIIEMFALVVFVCHWLGCIFHLIRRNQDWFQVDGDRNLGESYLEVFFWALYTVTTIGYGSVSVNSDWERVFAMLAMIIGAILCDAGITAVLTAIIEHMDHQFGTNKRRIDCSKKFMNNSHFDDSLTVQVLSYFEYCDNELQNLDEGFILEELNTSLKQRVLQHFCYQRLGDSLTYGGLEPGVLSFLCNQMKPYLAIPGERIIAIGEPDVSCYILQQGAAHRVDAVGDEEYLPVGSLLSNEEFRAVAKRVGMPNKLLQLNIVSASGLPTIDVIGGCNPYVQITVVSHTVYGESVKKCRTGVRKFTRFPRWQETFDMKVYHNTNTVNATLYHWVKGQPPETVGTVEIPIDKKSTEARIRPYPLKRDDKRIGILKMSVKFSPIEKARVPKNAEVSVFADSYCHLYSLQSSIVDDVTKYMKNIRRPIEERIPKVEDASSDGIVRKGAHRDSLSVLMGDIEENSLSVTANPRQFKDYMSDAFTKGRGGRRTSSIASAGSGQGGAVKSASGRRRSRGQNSFNQKPTTPNGTKVAPSQLAKLQS